MPFALLLALALALTWYAAYHLARAESAQPLPFAFGGEASPIDYARAIADGAVLALIASLGLLQLGHETTPELAQLAALSLYLYGLAASAHRALRRAALAAALALLAARRQRRAEHRACCSALVGAGVRCRASPAGGLAPRRWIARRRAARRRRRDRPSAPGRTGSATYQAPRSSPAWRELIAWFAWPAWLLALWTLWRWRRRLSASTSSCRWPAPRRCSASGSRWPAATAR